MVRMRELICAESAVIPGPARRLQIMSHSAERYIGEINISHIPVNRPGNELTQRQLKRSALKMGLRGRICYSSSVSVGRKQPY